ncbi:MAG: hypothetical protein HQL19_07440 [Candidatus Omnitrophica bacterium]|nr:hypothetical protein [Candidatus Omnitrophota bacterium]
MDKSQRDLLVFGYGLAVISAIFGVMGALKHGIGLPQVVLGACAIVFCGVTAIQWEALRPGYKGWMKVAHLIGTVVTTAILGVVFFGVFAPVGILFRLIGKDHLERKFDRAAASYWHKRPIAEPDPERYKQQY